jgi:hypothetical protein
MCRTSLLSILMSSALVLTFVACGDDGGGSVEMEPGLLGYWIESDDRGLITGDGDGYAWGVVFKDNGDMIRIRWDGAVVVEDANGPFDRLKYAIDGQYATREGGLGTYTLTAVTLGTGKTFPLMSTVEAGQTSYFLMVANLDGSSPEMDPLWDCSQEDHQTYLTDAQGYDDNLGPIRDGCYPVMLDGTLSFESDFADPDIPTIQVTFSGGKMTALNGVACEEVFPDQARTFSDCEIELMCGCCRLYFEAQDYNSYYQIDFPLSGSMDACEAFAFSGDFTYPM